MVHRHNLKIQRAGPPSLCDPVVRSSSTKFGRMTSHGQTINSTGRHHPRQLKAAGLRSPCWDMSSIKGLLVIITGGASAFAAAVIVMCSTYSYESVSFRVYSRVY